MNGAFKDRSEVFPVFVECPEGEVAGDLIGAPDLAAGLEEPGHELARLFFEVGVVAGITQRRSADLHSVEGFGDYVEVLACLQRNVDPDLGSEVTGPHAGREHDCLGLDLTLFGDHAGDFAVGNFQVRYRNAFDDSGPTGLGPFGQGHRGVYRRGLTVAGQVQRPDEIVGTHQRPQFTRLVEVDHPGLNTDPFCHRRAAQDFFPALFVVGDRY